MKKLYPIMVCALMLIVGAVIGWQLPLPHRRPPKGACSVVWDGDEVRVAMGSPECAEAVYKWCQGSITGKPEVKP